MGWTDRDYNQSQSGGNGSVLLSLVYGAVPLGTWFGIRVRMHASLVLFIALTLIFSGTKGDIGFQNAAVSMTILFFSVLLHEFGHCFGARWVGGEATEILMWPLGGLATTAPPHRPWASFFSTAMGPAVNLLICIITATAIIALTHLHPGSSKGVPWFPFRGDFRKNYVPTDVTTYYLFWIFLVNYALLTFNLLLVFYPFDGGRMIQELMWVKMGYAKSMRIALVVGMVGAGVTAVIALFWLNFMLLFIAGFGFYACYRQRQIMRETGADEEWQSSLDFSESLKPDPPRKRLSARAVRRAQKAVAAEHAEQDQVDTILAKVSATGMASLTWFERRILHQATARKRKHEADLTRERK